MGVSRTRFSVSLLLGLRLIRVKFMVRAVFNLSGRGVGVFNLPLVEDDPHTGD